MCVYDLMVNLVQDTCVLHPYQSESFAVLTSNPYWCNPFPCSTNTTEQNLGYCTIFIFLGKQKRDSKWRIFLSVGLRIAICMSRLSCTTYASDTKISTWLTPTAVRTVQQKSIPYSGKFSFLKILSGENFLQICPGLRKFLPHKNLVRVQDELHFLDTWKNFTPWKSVWTESAKILPCENFLLYRVTTHQCHVTVT